PFRFSLGPELIFQNRVARFFGGGLKFLVPDFTEPSALLARAMGRVEREQSRIEFFERAATIRTAHLGAHDREPVFRIEEMCSAAANIERAFPQVARFRDS